MKIHQLLQALTNVAEKGACIARIIRSESSLLELLVQEKKGNQKNQRFVHDFKTLADVLVQEMVRYDLSALFPGIEENIHGEESNRFTNALGDSVTVTLQPTVEQTSALLATILNDNKSAADFLSHVIHTEVQSTQSGAGDQLDQDLSLADIGVWIDPIDSTAQYIAGDVAEPDSNGLTSKGLQCVSVLIGVYSKSSGLPLVGVLNQPFYKLDTGTGRWTGRATWGVCVENVLENSISDCLQVPQRAELVVLLSSSESQSVRDILSADFFLHHISGAGNKLLSIIHGHADAYVLSQNTIFKWDCCGPHAILRSQGGGIVSYREAKAMVENNGGLTENLTFKQVTYNGSDIPEASGANKWCMDGGIIAYRSKNVLERILRSLQKI